jgi:hypothetical protein
MIEITWRAVQVETGSWKEAGAEPGQMIMVNGRLVAILVHLTGPYNTPELRGKWFIEAGFGPLCGKHELFSTLEEAEHWVLQHYLAERKPGPERALQS